MKRLVNDGYEVVEEMLEGYAAANVKGHNKMLVLGH
ncbi:Uncharacterised protein [Enterococcus malodoratus]|uniref:Uncharacterized protein n=1 Tax=Enterococcus malodoratus ATCC 43197 TaxID=1158601 RepID=R2NN87_9ENTE|nr:hypothetical protein UAI_03574 [Enterococcus malodoratus ATCC 43197]EOT67235.1 hypothetical protein I585_02756 [Enterococcus malodoratus ATCC 43197]SPW90887.1 Uncharacterised protein [Enterococcus malodoratus]STD69513.1 Uncharacterised protein [Enterococcus malodoratus]